ncbi:hypothetical protein AB0K71_05915 [Streptomyces syringium]|uniref:hypothetical protein n=1 Tax=Streptomyces syringium TaxID=76729 RepID=UPI0034190861
MNRLRDALAIALLRTTHRAAGHHVYLSTSCQHDQHGYCSSNTGSNGTVEWDKAATRCKFCPATCICRCHRRCRSRRSYRGRPIRCSWLGGHTETSAWHCHEPTGAIWPVSDR